MNKSVVAVSGLLAVTLSSFLLVGCAAPQTDERPGIVSSSAQADTNGIMATVPVKVAKLLYLLPAGEKKKAADYFRFCAFKLEEFANARVCYVDSGPLWELIEDINAPSLEAKGVVCFGAKFFKGGNHSINDASAKIQAIADALRLGLKGSLADVEKESRLRHRQYAWALAGAAPYDGALAPIRP